MKFVAAESIHKVPKTGGPKSAILRGGSRVVGSGRAGSSRVGTILFYTLNIAALRAKKC